MSVIHTDNHCVLLSTVASAHQAETLATLLVENNFAACVSIVQGVQSIYKWQGQLQNEMEWLLLIKTHRQQIEGLAQFLQASHPYSCPELIELPIHSGLSPYLNWVSDMTLS